MKDILNDIRDALFIISRDIGKGFTRDEAFGYAIDLFEPPEKTEYFIWSLVFSDRPLHLHYCERCDCIETHSKYKDGLICSHCVTMGFKRVKEME